jgi:hypothetical protein
LSVTAMVADGLMRLSWSARKAIKLSSHAAARGPHCRNASFRVQQEAFS